MTYVKICGLTTLADVQLAVEQNAWACGFVLTRSPRRVDPLRARELARAARTSLTVAVVTTESPTWIAAALAAADLRAVQLSAGADGPSVAAVRAAALAARCRGLTCVARSMSAHASVSSSPAASLPTTLPRPCAYCVRSPSMSPAVSNLRPDARMRYASQGSLPPWPPLNQ